MEGTTKGVRLLEREEIDSGAKKQSAFRLIGGRLHPLLGSAHLGTTLARLKSRKDIRLSRAMMGVVLRTLLRLLRSKDETLYDVAENNFPFSRCISCLPGKSTPQEGKYGRRKGGSPDGAG